MLLEDWPPPLSSFAFFDPFDMDIEGSKRRLVVYCVMAVRTASISAGVNVDAGGVYSEKLYNMNACRNAS